MGELTGNPFPYENNLKKHFNSIDILNISIIKNIPPGLFN